jgi:hypothetical protein
MDIHYRVVGILHIIEATFLMLAILMMSLFFGVIAAFAQIDPSMIAFIVGLGSFIALPILCLCIGQIVAAIALLRGNQSAKIWVMIFGALSLFNFPIGTALGIYTFWVLLKELPTTTQKEL